MAHDSLRAAVAGIDELDLVASILEEAAAWLAARGIRQWPARFRPEVIQPAIEAGETWLFRVDGEAAGTITIDDADPVWADSGDPALYLHRLAIRRSFPGLGGRILDWADARAATQGRRYLRGDCLAANDALLAYYLRAGFSTRGTATVGGSPGQRLGPAAAAQTVVMRIERAVPHQPHPIGA